MTYRYAIHISYEGGGFCGWQKQLGVPTVQESIENALSTILRTEVSITGSSRTDTGVHALGQIAHVDLSLPIKNIPSLLLSLRGVLPRSITVFSIREALPSFHARFSAHKKKYYYYIDNSLFQDPFSRRFSYHVKRKLDLNRLRKGASFFLGEHDFTAFANDSKQGAAKNKPVKTIHTLDIVERSNGYTLVFEADGFLYKMVRNITGCLLAYEQGKITDIPKLLQQKDRKQLPAPAPAHGLFLMEVTYPKEVDPFPAHQKKEHRQQESLNLPLEEDNELGRLKQAAPAFQEAPSHL